MYNYIDIESINSNYIKLGLVRDLIGLRLKSWIRWLFNSKLDSFY